MLTLSDVQVEDSAVIECAAGKPSARKASLTLAVCGQINVPFFDLAYITDSTKNKSIEQIHLLKC